MTLEYNDLTDYRHLQWDIILCESQQAMAFGLLLLKKLGMKSVIDVGCGPGIYLLPHKWRGCEVFGIDGCDGAGQCLDPKEFELVDLRQPWIPPKEYDMSLCIEVAEHIQPEYVDILMDTLCKCAPLCCFTAARPGQGGCGHFNCQDKSYWVEKFGVRGFVLYEELTRDLHSVIDVDCAYEPCQWMRHNFMVFRQEI
jgi:SAM-dependent methyltransferase